MSKHEKTIERLKRQPTASDLKWDDVAALFKHFGFDERQGNGSRCKFFHPKTGRLASLHRPHPSPDMSKGAVDYVRDFLIELELI